MMDEGEEASEKSVFLDRVEAASYNPSPRISAKSGILSASNEGFFLDIPSDDEIVYVGSRRCSARALSQSVQQTLRQLRKDQYDTRVAQLLERNAVSYRRQRYCECVTMITILVVFTCFSLYVVFAYGFHFGKGNPFRLINDMPRKIVRNQDDSVDLVCQADTYWEWCRWIHSDRFCDYEWLSSSRGAQEIGCDFPENKVELIGDYNAFECGIRVYNLGVKDRGVWQCEVEKYYLGFSRRYGELETSLINLVVKERRGLASSPAPTTSTETPMASALTPNSFITTIHNTTLNPLTELQEYQRQFFLLKMFVLGGVGFVLATLTAMFWAYFMYLWKTWDAGKRESIVGPGVFPGSDREPGLDGQKSRDELNSGNGDELGLPSDINQALLHSRRKSVSFAVCTLDEDTMSFNIERKSVFLGDPSRQSTSPMFAQSSPLLVQMAKKLKEVAGVKPKRRSRKYSRRNISNLVAERQLQVSQEVMEICDEQLQIARGERTGSAEIKETQM